MALLVLHAFLLSFDLINIFAIGFYPNLLYFFVGVASSFYTGPLEGHKMDQVFCCSNKNHDQLSEK